MGDRRIPDSAFPRPRPPSRPPRRPWGRGGGPPPPRSVGRSDPRSKRALLKLQLDLELDPNSKISGAEKWPVDD